MSWFLRIITLGVPSIIESIAKAVRDRREQKARLGCQARERERAQKNNRILRSVKRIAGVD